MKFGLSFLPDSWPTDKSSADYFKEAIELCKIADQTGFSSIKMTENYLHAYGGYCPNPLSFLSAVASVTKNVRLMTGCLLPVFHHPIQIAAEAAMLDAISNGRLDLGFARAYLPYEFESFQISMDESRERFTTTIETVIKLWTETRVSVKTPFFAFENATSLPLPVQSPHPPIWCAAVTSRESFAWIAEKGFGLLVTPPIGGIENLIDHLAIYRDIFSEMHPNKPLRIAISLPILLNQKQNIAELQSDTYLGKYLNIWSDSVRCWSNSSSTDYPGYQWVAKKISSNTPSNMRSQFQAMVGTPEFVLDEILKLSKLLGITDFLWQIDFGSQPYEVSLNTIKLFSEKIIPKLHV